MKSVRSLTLSLALLLTTTAIGWTQSFPAKAFDNVTIHMADGETIENGTIVWRNGLIEDVGGEVDIPFDAYVIDGGDSLHIYPGFLDGLALWGSPDLPENYEKPKRPGDPGYERAGIQPHRRPSKVLEKDDKNLAKAQEHGFTTAALGLKGQMIPGQVDLFFLNGEDTPAYLMESGTGLLSSFRNAPGGFGNGAYPATTMGVMAQYRQLWYNAEALKQQSNYFASTSSDYPAPKRNEVLEALLPFMEKEGPLFFVADTKENIERVFSLQDELGFELVIVSGEEAHKQAEELKDRGIPVLASIDFPEKPEWKVKQEKAEEDTSETETRMEEVTDEMRIFRERQLAAYKADVDNIRKLMEAGVRIGYASNGMKLEDLNKHLTTLKEEGELSEGEILRLLTQQTADILGAGSRLGDTKEGRIASFTVFTKPFTDEEAKVRYSVSAGKLTEFESKTSEE